MKKEILFVDDESQVLDGLRLSLRGFRKEWNCHFALGGELALEKLAEGHIDIVVSDVRMPGMDGTELLRRVQQEYPHIIRLTLSGYAEDEALMRAVQVTHQYLSKPCSTDDLSAAIRRGCWVHELVENKTLRALVGGIKSLPAAPSVYNEINRLIAADEASPEKMAALLEQDMALCLKVLQVVNSAFFRLARQITSVKEAVVYLGLDTVSQLVLAQEVFGQDHTGLSQDALLVLQSHSLLTATIASRMVKDKAYKPDAFLGGMLHDVGQLILATGRSDEYKQIEQAVAEGRDRGEAERELFEVDHPAVGAYLLGIWGLPYSVIEAVARHHDHNRDLEEGEIDAAAAVYIAHELQRNTGEDADDSPFQQFLQRNGLANHQPAWRQLAAELAQPNEDAA